MAAPKVVSVQVVRRGGNGDTSFISSSKRGANYGERLNIGDYKKKQLYVWKWCHSSVSTNVLPIQRYQITRGKNKEIGFFKELTLNQRFAWFLLRSELTIILELTSCRTGIFEDASAKSHVHVKKNYPGFQISKKDI